MQSTYSPVNLPFRRCSFLEGFRPPSGREPRFAHGNQEGSKLWSPCRDFGIGIVNFKANSRNWRGQGLSGIARRIRSTVKNGRWNPFHLWKSERMPGRLDNPAWCPPDRGSDLDALGRLICIPGRCRQTLPVPDRVVRGRAADRHHAHFDVLRHFQVAARGLPRRGSRRPARPEFPKRQSGLPVPTGLFERMELFLFTRIRVNR